MLSFCQRFIMKIQSDNIGHKTRLRNRFVNEGMENFEPHEVLELCCTNPSLTATPTLSPTA